MTRSTSHPFICPKSPEKGHTGSIPVVGADGEPTGEMVYSPPGFLAHAATCDDAFATLPPDVAATVERRPSSTAYGSLSDDDALRLAASRHAARSAPAVASAAVPDLEARITAAVVAALKAQ